MTYELPASYDPNDNRSVAIPRALIPLIAGRLRGLEYAGAWIEADQVTGPQAALLIQERLNMPATVATTIPGAPYEAWIAESGYIFQDQTNAIPSRLNDPVRSWRGIHGKTLASPNDQFFGEGGISINSLLRTEAFDILIPQPFIITVVVDFLLPTGPIHYIWSAIPGQTAGGYVTPVGGESYLVGLYGGSAIAGYGSSSDELRIYRYLLNGTDSKIWENGVLIRQGNCGSASLNGLTLGQRWDSGTFPFPITVKAAVITYEQDVTSLLDRALEQEHWLTSRYNIGGA